MKTLCLLGILFAVSSLTFYTSFHHMDAGIASTLLFVYPIMVAVIMSLFFKERISPVTMFSIILALSGIALLYRGGTGAGLNGLGVSLVMIASLTYALYIVVINQSSIKLSSIKLTFYVLLFCMVAIVFHSFFDGSNYLQPLTTPRMWLFAIMLALVPTVISLVTMTMAVHAIGSTPTAIMGALEPLTAVIIGVTVFGEIFLLVLITYFYYFFEDRRMLIGGKNIALIFTVLDLSLIVSFLFGKYVHIYARPVALAALLVFVLVGRRDAIFMNMICAILMFVVDNFSDGTAAANNVYSSFIIAFSAGMIAIFFDILICSHSNPLFFNSLTQVTHNTHILSEVLLDRNIVFISNFILMSSKLHFQYEKYVETYHTPRIFPPYNRLFAVRAHHVPVFPGCRKCRRCVSA